MRSESPGIGIQSEAIESPPLLIWFAAVEDRAFQFPVSAKQAAGEHAKTDVSGVLPMVGQRRGEIVHGRRSGHERNGAEGRLAGRRGVDWHADTARERALVHH